MMSEQQMQVRLHRIYENAKNSLNIETQVCQAGVHAQATMYHMDISFRSTRNKWSIAKRYSEFYKVRRTLQKFLKQFKLHHGDASFPLPLKTLEEAMIAAFPRRHLRTDTLAIIEERKPALETFVQLLVKVIASIPLSDSSTTSVTSPLVPCPATAAAVSPVPAAVGTTTDASNSPLHTPTSPIPKECESMAFLYQVLRDFLEYPDKQIESETKLKLAVLSLEDVIVSSQSNVLEGCEATNTTAHCLSECCSICLGDWDDEECVGMNVVKLPCLHAFHEECVMEWLHGNTHCPMCREEPTVGGSPSTSPSKDPGAAIRNAAPAL